MRRIVYIILIVLITGCEDVVEVVVPAEKPRLIIDAIIRVDESEPVVILSVKVSLTSPFFGEVPVANLKQISMSNSQTFAYSILNETEPGSGIYNDTTNLNFVKEGELIFQVEHEDQRYLARAQYVPVDPIDTLIQGEGARSDGGKTEILTTFTDNSDRDDFYLFDYGFSEYFTTDDEFYQGQQLEFPYFYSQQLERGQEVEVSILGVDKPFYNYMNQLIEQSKTVGFDPFATPAATVRGNIINVTEIDNIDYYDNVYQTDNFALGYFAIVQTHTRKIVIK